MFPIFSSEELRKIEKAIKNNEKEIEISIDLGLTKTKINLSKEGFIYDGNIIKLPKIREDDKICYILNGELQKVQFFVDNQLYKLIPTSFRPILKISETSMHKKEFVERIEKDKLKGKVLDAGTGLGYTAITIARTADSVTTVEFDDTVIEMQKLNPYSQQLFNNKKIKSVYGDIVDEIKKFRDEEFDFIIFDAGTPKHSGDFFSMKNYDQAFRVLKKGGTLYHYLPRHQINSGRDFGEEVLKRIRTAGFSEIERDTEGSYAVCLK